MNGTASESRRIAPSRHRPRAAGIALALVAALAASPGPASGQALDANLWVTDGDVGVIVPSGNTLYIGGSFAYVGPNTGGWTEIDEGAHATTRLPRVDGDVTATVADGAGGWFVAGTYSHIAGLARPGLAHVLADGSVAAWTPSPSPTGMVTSLEHQGTRLFVATDAGVLEAFDDGTGAAIAGWTPQVFGLVSSLAVDGTTLYAGGDVSFTITSTSQPGTGIAAIHTTTGEIADWDPAPDAAITKLVVDGRWLYATGGFTTIGGQSHEVLARALLSTRVFDSAWSPSVDSPVSAMATAGDGFWIGGSFFLVNGELHDRIAVLDTTSGATLSLAPDLSGIDGPVSAIAVRAPNVYLGMSPLFALPIGGAAKPLVIRAATGTGKVDKLWRALGEGSPTGEVGSVASLRFSPTGLLAAGRFVSLGGRRLVGVAALDRLSGIPRGWDPGLAVDEAFPVVPFVAAIVPTDHAIYLGGYFTRVGGQPRKSLAAVDATLGRTQSWRADLGPVSTLGAGTATSLALYQDKLVVGGSFSSISSASHAGLAEVDTVTGAPVAGFACDVVGSVNRLLVRTGTVFVGGAFSSAGGQPRSHLAAVNASTGAVLGWNPGVAGNAVQALAERGDTLYVGGDYSQAGGQTRICLAAVSATTGSLLGWAPAAFGPVRALWIDGPNIFVGGEFSFIVSQPQPYLAGLDRFSGALVNGTAAADATVLALVRDSGSLYVGGSFGSLAQGPTAYFGRAGAADGLGPTVTVVAANGGEWLVIGTTYQFEYAASDPSGVASVDVELSRAGSNGPWVMLAAGLRNTGHYAWPVTGPAVAAGAWLRVTARDFAGNVANDKSNAAFSIGAPVAAVEPTPDRGVLTAFSLGPSPARLRTELRFALSQPLRASFRLLDVQGREVWGRPEQSYAPGEHVVACELRGLEPGLYFMRLECGSASRLARLIVFR